jgi:hypothetical protein
MYTVCIVSLIYETTRRTFIYIIIIIIIIYVYTYTRRNTRAYNAYNVPAPPSPHPQPPSSSSQTSNHRGVPCVSHFQVAYISRLGILVAYKICRKNVIIIIIIIIIIYEWRHVCITDILCLIKNNNNKNPFYVKCHIVALFSFFNHGCEANAVLYDLHRGSGVLRPIRTLYLHMRTKSITKYKISPIYILA